MSAMVDEPQDPRRRRRNLRLALAHGVLALVILVAFVWYQVTH